MDSDEIKSNVKFVECLIDALGYCDAETYDLIFEITDKKLASLLKSNPQKFAYLEAYLSRPGMPDEKMEAWYNDKMRQSSEAGVAEAQYQHACRLWERGDHEAAVNLYKASADQGFPKSQYCYGLGLRDGVGVPQDKAKGLFYIELAAGRLYEYALEYLIGLYRDDLSNEGRQKFTLYSEMLRWSESET
ncbi:hypothetical protein GCM10011309_26840 [Litorimonas cladophorae]|uniref:Sel1 repeat family protein n=1 Tax=Litorimonas cladophorae TaxID=1220491 RepID=A0A918KVL7_9PROT|nr:sel1 repeat family protein [Litorimonas cladophorae]GGX75255.1 hypothetical protein GCM10011309_26840 [Litorimonas cladophorae]